MIVNYSYLIIAIIAIGFIGYLLWNEKTAGIFTLICLGLLLLVTLLGSICTFPLIGCSI